MKSKTSHKSINNTQSIANYTRTKDAYDGNMELTNLKASSKKISGMAKDSSKDEKGDRVN